MKSKYQNNSKNKKVILKRNFKILALVAVPVVLALLILFIGNEIGSKIYSEHVPENFFMSLSVLVLFVISFGGVVQIIKRESPGIFEPKTGTIAIIQGTIWVAICYIAIIFISIELMNI